MGVPNSHLTPNFVTKYRVSNNCFFLPNYQLTVNPTGPLLDCSEHLDYIRLVPMIKDLLGIVLWTFLIKVELLVELCYQTLVPALQIFQREKFLA